MQNSRFRNAKAQLSFFKETIFTKQECFFTFVIKQQIDNFSAVFLLWQSLSLVCSDNLLQAQKYTLHKETPSVLLFYNTNGVSRFYI